MIELAIVGAGIMGANHARLSAGLRNARLGFVVDPDAERARLLAEPAGARWATEMPAGSGWADAVVLAVPTELHRPVGVELLRAGLHVLVEKPIAANLDDAQALVDAATDGGATLMVGHVEQFNPAVLELDRLLSNVVHVEAARISPYSARVREGVILDLMIHDLHLVQRLAGAPLADVQAVARHTRSDSEDLCCALLRFDNGMTANVTASRIGHNKVRRLQIIQADNFVHVDLLRQDITIHRIDHSEYLSEAGARYRQSGVVEIPFLEHRGEPLFLELQHFVDCVVDGTRPRVSGEDGLEALRLALAVEKASNVR